MKRAAVLGGAGFIGTHLCDRLVKDGYEVTSFDIKEPEFGWKPATGYIRCDLREQDSFASLFELSQFDEVYQLAAEMGGAGFVFTGLNDANIMSSSVRINLNVLDACKKLETPPKVFFASSACVYRSIVTTPKSVEGTFSKGVYAYQIPGSTGCREDEGVEPDSDYGFEKLFSEKLYDAYYRNHQIDIRIGRFHNVYGPFGTWIGGREKAPAALCRKIALARPGGEIEVWGTGKQTRSFIYVDEAVEGVRRLMQNEHRLPVNIGSSQLVAIENLAQMIASYAEKDIVIKPVPGPVGVDGRNSDNTLIQQVTGWQPSQPLWKGIRPTYDWIKEQVDRHR